MINISKVYIYVKSFVFDGKGGKALPIHVYYPSKFSFPPFTS
jgi:hypothetical protein